MGAYTRTYYKGKRFNKRTVAMLRAVERRTGQDLQIIQGSYNSGVGASAGTHDGGGAVDLWASNPTDVVNAMRRVGFAAWVRSPAQGPWGYHIHGIAIGDKDLSSGARAQVTDYYNGYDGLAGSGRDYHWRPSPIPVFRYRKRKKVVDYSRVMRQFLLKRKTVVRGAKLMQRALNKRMGTHLPVDGIAGPRTRAVFRKYRKRTRLGPLRALRRLGRNMFRTKR